MFSGADLQGFNAATVSSPVHDIQVRSGLYNASYNTTNQLTADDLKNLVWQSQERGIVPVGVTLVEFQVVNLDNYHRYRLRAGRTNADVYQTRRATTAATLTLTIGRGVSVLHLPEWATFSAQNVIITGIAVDSGDGNPGRTLTPGNATASVYCQSTGSKTIRYVISLSDGSQRTALSTVTVTDAVSSVDCGNCAPVPSIDNIGVIDKLSVEGYEPFQGYEETYASKGKGDAFIYYARGRNRIRKPVTVLDGFDPGDVRSAQDVYLDRLPYEENPRRFQETWR